MSKWGPVLIVVAATVVVIAVLRWWFRRSGSAADQSVQFRIQAWTVAAVFAGFLAAIFVLPETVDRNLALSVVGLVVTGALAISGQSIIANGMAGIMLRIIKNFRPGDFLEVDDHTGRVSEMGLFHTEIQTPDRDLVTLPNALMVNRPVRVVRSSGTIVSVRVGLGYDLSRHRLKELFIKAAEQAELEDPFVQVVDLGDYAVTYRVAGFLAESTRLLAARSRLREAILDTLSEANIEIMSPMYVARRSVSNEGLIPARARPKASVENRPTAEDKVFDKAEIAAGAEELKAKAAETTEAIEKLEALAVDQVDGELAKTQALIETERAELDRLNEQITRAVEVQETQD